MAKDERKILESIAVDMVCDDMENIGEDISDIWYEVENLTDSELLDFLCFD